MPEEIWISFNEAVQMVRDRMGASVGRSQAIVREAIASGEIRATKSRTASLYLIGDDGLEGLISVREADERATSLNVEDLIDRLDQHVSAAASPPAREVTAKSKGRRYVEDEVLVAEGVAGIKSGIWPNPLKAATALAGRARGQSLASTITRLRKKIRIAIGD